MLRRFSMLCTLNERFFLEEAGPDQVSALRSSSLTAWTLHIRAVGSGYTWHGELLSVALHWTGLRYIICQASISVYI